ncbi:MAG: ABC transporter substrate-binding protein [Cellulosilyticaceae bacterium]
MKKLKKLTTLLLATMMLTTMTGCSGNKEAADGVTKLTLQIWDINQKEAMQKTVDAYTAQNPNVKIEVQVTNWGEYWTKLEAAATGNTMPDVFWMHTNEILKYANNGMLADLTDLYSEEDANYYEEHFSEGLLENAKGSDGKLYGLPKDKDIICLVYNKDMFDDAGVEYPNADWTWDDLISASETIYEETGKYGYMAYADDQLGYWNFVYQAGGYILNDEKTKAGFTDPATEMAMEFYTNIQKNDFCPEQAFFAEQSPGTAFFSGAGAMFLEGNWNLKAQLDNFPEMIGKWDVAELPKCPNPVSGDGRATISNGLTYATGAKGKNLEASKDFIKFLGTEEAQAIQGKVGVAIPAYNGLENTFIETYETYDYAIDIKSILNGFDYSVQSINSEGRPSWKTKVNDELLKIYSGTVSLQDGLANMQKLVDSAEQK